VQIYQRCLQKKIRNSDVFHFCVCDVRVLVSEKGEMQDAYDGQNTLDAALIIMLPTKSAIHVC